MKQPSDGARRQSQVTADQSDGDFFFDGTDASVFVERAAGMPPADGGAHGGEVNPVAVLLHRGEQRCDQGVAQPVWRQAETYQAGVYDV
ncbi:MAG: hypothetical protein ACRDS0_35205, partial [Pseudonocardiaceae bacterium]